jgi:hypothetical protein
MLLLDLRRADSTRRVPLRSEAAKSVTAASARRRGEADARMPPPPGLPMRLLFRREAVAQTGSVRRVRLTSEMPQNFIDCEREQAFLSPPSLRDWLAEEVNSSGRRNA